jgi:23S rRNA pseudouridine2605 synthase
MNERSDKAGDRIAKVIARAGLTSRREAEQWIAAGRVAVNGAVIHSPALNVMASDRISIDGEPLPTRERTRLFLYHKPRGLLTTRADPKGRPTVFEHLPKHLPRLISVGRLDFNTEGLLLLTNDGELARLLELPATGWLRRYRVRAHGSVTQAKLDALRGGVDIEGMHYGSVEATLDRVQGSNLWLTFAIREGKSREVRNVLGHLGLTVARLIRVSFGPFQLGELAEGAAEEVPTRVLREQLGERLVALSGADFSTPLSSRRSESKEQPRPQPKRKPSGRGISSHSWRVHENDRPAKKLKRKFHGSRRNDNTPRERAAAEAKRGELIDRKGRRVAVEQYGAQPEQAPQSPRKHGARHGQGPRFGKGRGNPRRR